MAIRYRDSETGQFVSKETWERSHGPGGDYYRESYDYYDERELDVDVDIDLEEDEY